ncbi:hypothetical protein IAQ61_007994 [Plenodomus lingam]|uniref:Predicted protein n=1 Tax=Leptosphaeria maculans (strain JN3 / isolate v23.1.3 / race Av1-4-5-6-7-8) TaxID=985895 RepID=E5A0K2_LEPMJ|nr:predicted protein [Plenodomus lingam JN3]KAH9867401.1 hypothetical protein IAQ61_007994 [Plenodomus lingam]CBX97062.1 predicted protein [Plenodomus lingam JN3]
MSQISTPSPTGTKNSKITTPISKSPVDTLNTSGSTTFKKEHGVTPNIESLTKHERKLSTDSGTTVESESWNPYDPETLEPLTKTAFSPSYPPKFSTDSTSTIESESWNTHDPKTPELEVKTGCSTAYPQTSPWSCFNTAVVGMSPLETLERYQLRDYGAGISEQSTRIYGFTYPAGVPVAKHVHFESTADRAASPLYRWKEEDKDTTDLDEIAPNTHTSRANKQNDKRSFHPSPSLKRTLDIHHAQTQHHHTHVSDSTPAKKPARSHRLLRSISESLSNLASAHAGTTTGLCPRKASGQAHGLNGADTGTGTDNVTDTTSDIDPTIQSPHCPPQASTTGSPDTRKRRRLGDRLLGALRSQKDMQYETTDSANK